MAGVIVLVYGGGASQPSLRDGVVDDRSGLYTSKVRTLHGTLGDEGVGL